MRRSDLIFESVQVMYYKFHKVNFRYCGSYIDSPEGVQFYIKKQQKNKLKSEISNDKKVYKQKYFSLS